MAEYTLSKAIKKAVSSNKAIVLSGDYVYTELIIRKLAETRNATIDRMLAGSPAKIASTDLVGNRVIVFTDSGTFARVLALTMSKNTSHLVCVCDSDALDELDCTRVAIKSNSDSIRDLFLDMTSIKTKYLDELVSLTNDPVEAHSIALKIDSLGIEAFTPELAHIFSCNLASGPVSIKGLVDLILFKSASRNQSFIISQIRNFSRDELLSICNLLYYNLVLITRIHSLVVKRIHESDMRDHYPEIRPYLVTKFRKIHKDYPPRDFVRRLNLLKSIRDSILDYNYTSGIVELLVCEW